MRLSWSTDIHLEFLTPAGLSRFVVTLARSKADAFLLGGDINQALGIEKHLRILERALERPVYFVLGNHDYYHGQVADIRERIAAMSAASPVLRWLPAVGAVGLSDDCGLLGHDGWADGRFGDYVNSRVLLNDYRMIEDFISLGPADRLLLMQALAQGAADFFRAELPGALSRWKRVIVLTHVPPFAEAAWHMGKISDKDWLPHFASQVTGVVLKETMEQHPDRELLVLCGHTHSPGEVSVLPNLKVITGGARYGHPEIQREWEV
ncbi:MAG TPA: metallophosphoesterase [Gemmatimonadales bacterium]|jgi:3',5'-cyclic AMP phosphodiesterase CpdA|nr:metallophosphoesterase [Gemmatimonadales bacterium]